MNRRTAIKAATLSGLGALLSSSALAGESCANLITPAQPEGPFYPKAKLSDQDADLVSIQGRRQEAQGTKILIVGKILDQNCLPVPGALVDLWQACHTGRYNHPADTNSAKLDPDFQYSAEILTAANGTFRLRTIIPGAYPASGAWVRPPHIHLRIEKLGYHELTTQIYFGQFEKLNAEDLILKRLPIDEQNKLVMPANKAEARDQDLGEVTLRYDVTLAIQQAN